jgi:succinate dehydrogenase / fumarate reductase cytochrome b subunit
MHERPVNFNMFTIRLPITAMASFMHRISGLFLFLLIPLFLRLLEKILLAPKIFEEGNFVLVDSIFEKFILWIALTTLTYHLLAGIRHLLMDSGVGEELPIARISAFSIFFLTFIVGILFGIYIC